MSMWIHAIDRQFIVWPSHTNINETNITFGLDPEQSIYNVAQLQLHLYDNINNKNIFLFPKHLP